MVGFQELATAGHSHVQEGFKIPRYMVAHTMDSILDTIGVGLEIEGVAVKGLLELSCKVGRVRLPSALNLTWKGFGGVGVRTGRASGNGIGVRGDGSLEFRVGDEGFLGDDDDDSDPVVLEAG